LVIEAFGKRLTGLASASPSELDSALAHLIELAHARGRALKVETYNAQPAVRSAVAPRLAELGFVRDYPGMSYYPAWAAAPDRRAAGTDVKI
jgi:ATP-dependent Lhr-like helicase